MEIKPTVNRFLIVVLIFIGDSEVLISKAVGYGPIIYVLENERLLIHDLKPNEMTT